MFRFSNQSFLLILVLLVTRKYMRRHNAKSSVACETHVLGVNAAQKSKVAGWSLVVGHKKNKSLDTGHCVPIF